MIVYTQRSFFGYHPVVNALNFIFVFLTKSFKTLMSLVSPEDTTNNGSEGYLQFAKYASNNIIGIIKTVFWIAISISIAFLMGRLS